jgi:hypothetical protein
MQREHNASPAHLKRKPANHFAIFSLLPLDSPCLNCARVRAFSSTISNRNKLWPVCGRARLEAFVSFIIAQIIRSSVLREE